MNILTAAILGIVEGLTEFLPVSSTFHLIFASNLLHISQSDFQSFFEVFIQSGAILAVVVLYFQYILKHKQYIKTVLISFIPTAIVGFVLHKIIKTVFFNSDALMLAAFLLMGIVFIVLEKIYIDKKIKLHKSINNIDTKSALLIGLFQSLAVVPGVSRAGIVLVSMMMMGYKRDEAAIYSFLLAVPTILGASALDLAKTDWSIISAGNILYVGIGFVAAFVSALIVIKWFIGFLQKQSLIPFGIYRIVMFFVLLFVK